MAKRGPKPKRKTPVKWSPDIAYAVGLIATDGCLSGNGRGIDFTSNDMEQLENFMRCIDKKVPITKKSSTFTKGQVTRVQFSDVVLYNFLLSVGLTPNKSKTIGPISVPEEFYFDFLRGHHDGDGSFHSYFDPRWKSSFMFYLSFVSASKAHIEWIRAENHRSAGVIGHVTKGKGVTVYQLKYAKRESLVMLKRMYASSTVRCLSRKRLKIERALRIVGESLPE